MIEEVFELSEISQSVVLLIALFVINVYLKNKLKMIVLNILLFIFEFIIIVISLSVTNIASEVIFLLAMMAVAIGFNFYQIQGGKKK